MTGSNLKEGEIPQFTKDFVEQIKSKVLFKKYIVEGLELELVPFLFPFESDFSVSSKVMYQAPFNYYGKRVLDVGTGSGILGILAAQKGAQVHGIDLLPHAVLCAQKNIFKNGLHDSMCVWQSDGLQFVEEDYDVFICNLPIVNADIPEDHEIWYSLNDPHFGCHRDVFERGHLHLRESGSILMSHADLQPGSFGMLEEMASDYNYTCFVLNEKKHAGYTWRTYEFRKKGE